MTCVEMPLRELGRRAVELVLDTPWDAPIRETLEEEFSISAGATVARRATRPDASIGQPVDSRYPVAIHAIPSLRR